MTSGHVAGGTADAAGPRARPSTEGEIVMEPQLIEWGPANLRDEPTLPELDLEDRPADD